MTHVHIHGQTQSWWARPRPGAGGRALTRVARIVTEGPWLGESPGWAPTHVHVCTHGSTWTHMHTDTLAYVCTQMWVCTCLHTVLVPCGEGPGCRGGGVDWHPTHISKRVIPYFQARKLSPMQHPTNPHPPPLGMGSSALALGMCCQEGEEQRTRKWTTGEWRWGYLRWNLIGQFAWKQRNRDSEKEGGWKRSRSGLREGAGVECHAYGPMQLGRWDGGLRGAQLRETYYLSVTALRYSM